MAQQISFANCFLHTLGVYFQQHAGDISSNICNGDPRIHDWFHQGSTGRTKKLPKVHHQR